MQLADPEQVADLPTAIAVAEASTVAQTLLVGDAAPVLGTPRFWYCKFQLVVVGMGGGGRGGETWIGSEGGGAALGT